MRPIIALSACLAWCLCGLVWGMACVPKGNKLVDLSKPSDVVVNSGGTKNIAPALSSTGTGEQTATSIVAMPGSTVRVWRIDGGIVPWAISGLSTVGGTALGLVANRKRKNAVAERQVAVTAVDRLVMALEAESKNGVKDVKRRIDKSPMDAPKRVIEAAVQRIAP